MTKLTVPITAGSMAEALATMTRAAAGGADLLEIRLDYLAEADCAALVRGAPLPILWTLRHASEGGKFTGEVAEQIDRLIAAIKTGGEYVDLEFRRWMAADDGRERLAEALSRLRRDGRDVKLILSFHDFQRTPSDVLAIAQKVSHDLDSDVVKVAGFANDVCDNFPIFDLLKNSYKPVIGIAMGPLGTPSRLLARKFDAELTFAALAPELGSAPGQLTLSQMKEEYNWDRIDPATALAGVVGHPVDHSLSPAMHNRAYRQMGVNAVYLKFDVADSPEAFDRFIEEFRARPWLGLMGLSVTIPHKGHALDYVRRHGGCLDPLAERIGAVNTLVFTAQGLVKGYNTDYAGILKTLEISAGLGPAGLAGKRVMILGGGGVSRAIVAATTAAGAEVTVFNRTPDRARTLAAEFGCQWRPWDERNHVAADVVINGTSVGMHPKVEDCPLEPAALRPGMVVFDTVYNPLPTKLLRQAQAAGAVGVSGADMLVFQAVEQIRLWLEGQEKRDFCIPADIMKDAVLSRL